MADDTQQLVYEVKVALGNSQEQVDSLKKSFEAAKKSIDTVNGSKVIFDTSATQSELRTLTSRLSEVRRALDFLNQGYTITINGKQVENAEGQLRAFEKLYDDMIKGIKSKSLNNLFDTNMKAQTEEISNALGRQKRLLDDYNKSVESGKAVSQSSYYAKRKEFDELNAAMEKYNIAAKKNPYSEQSYGQYGTSIQSAAQNRKALDDYYGDQQRKIKENSDAHRSALQSMVTLENQYERSIANVNTQIARGRQLSEEAYSKMSKEVSNAKKAMESAGGRSDMANPLESTQYSTRGSFNQTMAQGNAAEWTQGIRSYTSEINRLRAAQEALYVTYKQNPTQENLTALSKARQGVINLSREYEHYQSVIGNAATASDSFFGKLRSHYYWILAGGFVSAMIGVPAAMLKTITDVDEAMHNLGTVMPSLEESEKNVATEQTKLIETASQYGAAIGDIAESARLWGRMYKDIDTVNVLTSQSAKLAVADNFSMAESTKAVEAAMFQFGMTAKTSADALAYSNKIVDTYTALSHQSGVAAQDLAAGVERSGAAAAQAGVDFEFLTALIAQGTRATALSGSNIGDMLKTLFASIHSKKAVEELNKLGIAVENVDSNGVKHFRNVQDVLLDVAVVAQGTNNNLQNLFQQMSGGRPKLAA